MKPIPLFAMLLFAATCLVAQERGLQKVILNIDGKTTTLYRQSYALVIGVSRYTNGLKSLPEVSDDIPEVKNALEKNEFPVTVVMPNPVLLTMVLIDKREFANDGGMPVVGRCHVVGTCHGMSLQTFDDDNVGTRHGVSSPSGVSPPPGRIKHVHDIFHR